MQFSRFSTEPKHWTSAEDIMRNVGIQPGTTAGSKQSKQVDDAVKIVSKMLLTKYENQLQWIRKLSRKQVPFGNGACEPDGGIFIYKGKFIFSIEAKYQKASTNAIERWHKNHNILRLINPSISYLTFATGYAIHNAIPFALDCLHLGESNVDHPFYNSIYYNQDGFKLEEMFEIADRLLLTTMKGIDNDEASIYVGRWQDKINQALSTIYA